MRFGRHVELQGRGNRQVMECCGFESVREPDHLIGHATGGRRGAPVRDWLNAQMGPPRRKQETNTPKSHTGVRTSAATSVAARGHQRRPTVHQASMNTQPSPSSTVHARTTLYRNKKNGRQPSGDSHAPSPGRPRNRLRSVRRRACADARSRASRRSSAPFPTPNASRSTV